jgi:hypothetical protein
MVTALVPPKVVLTNKAPYFVNRSNDVPREAFLLAVLSSIPLDWFAKKIVELGFNFHLINTLPIPTFESSNPLVQRAIEISCKLAWQDERYTDWTRSAGYEVTSKITSEEFTTLVAELDVVMFLLYGLSIEQAAYIYENFHPSFDSSTQIILMQEFWRTHEK